MHLTESGSEHEYQSTAEQEHNLHWPNGREPSTSHHSDADSNQEQVKRSLLSVVISHVNRLGPILPMTM
jgi:hypothetical protein